MSDRNISRVLRGLFAVSLLASALSAGAATRASMKVDGRGLVEIPGVLRDNSDHHWGAMNLVAFGPGWSYSAQDYALKNIQKSGNSLTASFGIPGTKAVLAETWQMDAKRPDGSSATKMVWTLRQPDGQPLKLEQAFVKMPLGIKDFAGAAVTTDKGESATLPSEADKQIVFSSWGCSDFRIAGKDQKNRDIVFRITGDNLGIELADARKENGGKGPSAYWIKLHLYGVKDRSEATRAVWISADYPNEAAPPPPPEFRTAANADRIPFEFSPKVAEGSILDFSRLGRADAPAGKYGRIVVGPDGHYVYEKTGKRVRLVGANLCYTANTMSHEESDELVRDFLKMGYNAVRYHHLDVTTMKGGWNDFWNKTTRGELDPAALDRLDYLFAAMKKAGVYSTIDLYAMGAMGAIGTRAKVFGEIKGLVPISDEAFEVWKTSALEWMNHVNPYTGLAWKDEPSLVAICPLNEDSIASCWWSAKDEYNAAFDEWKKSGKAPEGRTDDQLRAQFLVEVKIASNRKIKEFFEANGITSLMTGSNWWDTMPQVFTRDSLDVVDNHQYCDHPTPGFHQMPFRVNHRSTISSGNPTYMVPVMMAATRIWGKPFVCTEWNFCYPNRHRAEAGVMMGAVSGLQDWDGLYRFAWAHGDGEIRTVPHAVSGFNIVTDPVGLLSERLFVLLFGRGDMPAARKRYVYGTSMAEATANGPGDMWAKGLFPHDFNALALESAIGSEVMDTGRPVVGSFEAVVAGTRPADESLLGGNRFVAKSELPKHQSKSLYVSDNGAFRLNPKTGWAAVDTERTDAVVLPSSKDVESVETGALRVSGGTTFASVSASAMDDKALEDSERVLVMHITDICNTDMVSSDAGYNEIKRMGTLPYLARKGSADVRLVNRNSGLKVYALKSDGTRSGREIPATYADGAYSFRVAVEGDAPTMVYELAR